jgi:hypothetical protein
LGRSKASSRLWLLSRTASASSSLRDGPIVWIGFLERFQRGLALKPLYELWQIIWLLFHLLSLAAAWIPGKQLISQEGAAKKVLSSSARGGQT